jgi:hypothetical protein
MVILRQSSRYEEFAQVSYALAVSRLSIVLESAVMPVKMICLGTKLSTTSMDVNQYALHTTFILESSE